MLPVVIAGIASITGLIAGGTAVGFAARRKVASLEFEISDTDLIKAGEGRYIERQNVQIVRVGNSNDRLLVAKPPEKEESKEPKQEVAGLPPFVTMPTGVSAPAEETLRGAIDSYKTSIMKDAKEASLVLEELLQQRVDEIVKERVTALMAAPPPKEKKKSQEAKPKA